MTPYEALTIEEYDIDNEYYIYKILKFFDIKYSIQEKGNQAKVEWMKLYRSKPIDYNFINEDIKHLKQQGECVKDNMIGTYSTLIKNFETKFNKYALEIDESNDGGYTSLQVQNICKELDIGFYAFDISKNVF